MFETHSIYINIVVFLLEAISIISLLYRNKSLRSQIAWIILIIFTNIFGVVIYWLITLKKRKATDSFDLKKQLKPNIKCEDHNIPIKIQNLIRKYNVEGYSYYDQEFIYNNKLVYKNLYRNIKVAKESIYICSYIFSFDRYNAILVKELLKKAKSGVKIYIIVDAFGTNTLISITNIVRLLLLKRKGLNIKVFSPLTKGIFSGSLNHRNHRKVYIFDRKISFIGGANLSKDFLATHKDVWQDSLIMFKGELSSFYSKLFVSDWNFISSNKIEDYNHSTDCDISLDEASCAYPIPSGPDVEDEVLYSVLCTSIAKAENSVVIVSPYFVPPKALLDIIQNASLSGVKITIFIPLKTDTYLLNKLNYSYTDEIKEFGVEVLYTRKKVHSKLVIIDESYAFVGSANFDYRSLLINYEITAIFSDKKTLNEIDCFIKILKDNSITKEQACTKSSIFDKLMRLLSPIT